MSKLQFETFTVTNKNFELPSCKECMRAHQCRKHCRDYNIRILGRGFVEYNILAGLLHYFPQNVPACYDKAMSYYACEVIWRMDDLENEIGINPDLWKSRLSGLIPIVNVWWTLLGEI